MSASFRRISLIRVPFLLLTGGFRLTLPYRVKVYVYFSNTVLELKFG